MNTTRRIDEDDLAAVYAAIDEIAKMARESETVLKGIREMYDFKRKYNPRMMDFDKWMRDVWAQGVFEEANRHCGGYTIAKAERIADIQFRGTPFTRNITKKYPDMTADAYVEEGRVWVTIGVPRGDVRSASPDAGTIHDEMVRAGYADVEAVWDFDEDFVPVTGSRKFV